MERVRSLKEINKSDGNVRSLREISKWSRSWGGEIWQWWGMWAVLREIAEWWNEIQIEKLMWGLLLSKGLGLNEALRMWSVHESAAALRWDTHLKELEHCFLPWSFACPKTNAANGSFILKRNYSRNPKSAKKSNNLRRTHSCFWFLHRLSQARQLSLIPQLFRSSFCYCCSLYHHQRCCDVRESCKYCEYRALSSPTIVTRLLLNLRKQCDSTAAIRVRVRDKGAPVGY
jgi:hypothetical protein